jgi:hypothetical protein
MAIALIGIRSTVLLTLTWYVAALSLWFSN